MPAGRFRSRTFRRVQRKVPGGRTAFHYRKRAPGPAKCVECGALLNAVPRARPYKMSNMAKSLKRPQRLYGGVLCSKCSRNRIKDRIRV